MIWLIFNGFGVLTAAAGRWLHVAFTTQCLFSKIETLPVFLFLLGAKIDEYHPMANASFPHIEKEVLDFWKKKNIFQKSLDKESPQGEFVFYDGPPFATGLPHYGHIVANVMKDMVPRYWTMRGYHVERRWGWDCHGLPIENIVEQELGLKHKRDIVGYGIGKFNAACRSKILTYAGEWRKTVERLGRWVDMDNDYKTMDVDYMESEWWVFKQLWDKKLIYKDYKSMHICPRCETTLAQAEVSEGYKEVEDVSVTVKFKVKGKDDLYILAWTTTPWTLMGNAALAIGAGRDFRYVELTIEDSSLDHIKKGQTLIMADNTQLIRNVFGGDPVWLEGGKRQSVNFHGTGEIVFSRKSILGDDVVGLEYEPLFPYYKDSNIENIENAWRIYAADFVSLEEGTGVVHIAPAFGEDDMNFGRENNLPFIQHVNMDGTLKKEVVDFKGLEVKPKNNVHATDDKIIEYLKKKGLVFASEKYLHSYPHCWRCETPLLNYATDSWFVAVTKVKKDLLRYAENINWTPAFVKEGRFGNWLQGAKDWSISRERFWGTPVPVWHCENEGCKSIKVVGSIAELAAQSREKINMENFDLHRPFIDEVALVCDECGGAMRLEGTVLDCWFESGSMPYAQVHYPFANKEKFEKNFPAQFIAEGADQVSKWFYYLHVLAGILRASHAFDHVIVNGIVLAEDGKKMSKRLQNYPKPDFIFEKYGADALRYYLASSPVMRIEDLRFSEKDVEEIVKKVLLILMNVLSFYEMYERGSKAKSRGKPEAKNVLDRWILAKLGELNREVTKGYENYDLNKATRPLGRFVAELSTWYVRRSRDRFKAEGSDKDEALATLRYVLTELSILMAPVTPFIADHIYRKLDGGKESVHLEEWPESAALTRGEHDLLASMADVREVVEDALALRAKAGVKVRQPLAELKIRNRALGEDFLQIIKDEVNVKNITQGAESTALDTEITEELKLEGVLREIVRRVNSLRKKAGLTIHDTIALNVCTESPLVRNMLEKFGRELEQATIADSVSLQHENIGGTAQEFNQEFDIEGQKVVISIRETGS